MAMEMGCPLFGGKRKSFCSLCSVVRGVDGRRMRERCAESISRYGVWNKGDLKSLLRRITWIAKEASLPHERKAGLTALLSRIDMSRQSGDIIRLVGNAYAFLGYNKDSMEAFDLAIMKDHNDVIALNNKGVILARMGRETEALCCYKAAVEIDPGNENAWFNMGKAYSRIGKFRRAADCYRKVIEINPKNVSAWNNLGVSMRSAGKIKRAIDCYLAALRIDQNYKWAWNNLGIAHMLRRRYKKAEKCLRKALEIDPSFKEAKETLEACLHS